MSRRLSPLLFLLALPVSLSAAEATIDRAFRTMAGVNAGFVQEFRPQGSRAAQTERGRVLFGSLPNMRWEYDAPERKTFVFDGSRSFFYLPLERQVTVSRLSEEQRKSYPFLFLGNRAARERAFRSRERSRSGLTTITLEPRDRSSQLRQVIMTTRADSLLRSIEYIDRVGNRTLFRFDDHRRGPMPADAFRFTPPPGVEVIGE